VLVPFPAAVDDHQTKNAEVMARIGAAQLVQERDLSAERLGGLIAELGADRPRLLEMAQAARASRITDAAAQLADLCIAAAERP
jgi:UDP-N-acetylglucosamine--N-acetylmuramyl-(pentapeptide) pyrophosphoryl-undecaprenol N-acetylglucosamine transferase